MRVVGGEYKSRRLKAVPGTNTRPTSDKVKESLFNMIGPYFSQGSWLDFYGGSGGVAIEAVSRGMEQAVIIEKYRPAIRTIYQNIDITKEPQKFTVLKGDNKKALLKWQKENKLSFNYLFLDPPYAKQNVLEDIQWLEEHHFLADQCIIICELASQDQLVDEWLTFHKINEKKYGDTTLHIYERGEVL
ncbi:16S rRNA (guanine(966)-N(2))-methyltransferase RsmD [Dolosicoccus paucivorans]|uniref:16S rRNA (Guanine(966)-N(2))-methyltransferase RsmD n=1 Tax=Dolosicoccus paucivorans TaxID=84521 RepID=A0A1G8KGR9_9LACT|nr:16S rRNA (guanine(966)-N(2))-methyltransferase RsmD [Dolosicoccus paucivorans]PMB84612.1 16S rRNA (guanine(966)-N(2))-methyltransferase RsmD [Dolosicoccus paucivorans]PMC58236.1 16S rRNA (guanine(966)-N(2))-methyltransferase RsmD [Dolosicoccus paucivorans]SDI42617.1 16S rRNA (guanine(966)-N(2))-methyltransferase RsmD [Dolosicoccus paucivorans]